MVHPNCQNSGNSEAVMVGDSWLDSWLRLSFYGDVGKCQKHPNQHKPWYCGMCKDDPICEICWQETKKNEHESHYPILKVCSVSRKAAARVKDISELLDISGILQIKCNDHRVVYLKPNSDTKPQPNHQPDPPKCLTCGRSITNTYTFCSIECKKLRTGSDLCIRRPPPTLRGDFLSFRKRSRKGPPHRAPLK